MSSNGAYQLALTTEDNAVVTPILDDAAKAYDSIEDLELVRSAPVLARGLPRRLLEFLECFRISEPAATCAISGLTIHPDRLGPTPEHWRDSHLNSSALRQEIFLLLCSSVLGDVFGWGTQQDGRLMHDVLPIKGHEHQEIGSNSLRPLSWHTEDAFHPCRGDYVALMCLKNPDGVETFVCSTADIDWSRVDKDALFEPDFTIMPDNSHQPHSDSEPGKGDPQIEELVARSFKLIERWNKHPERRALLFGDRRDPYLALDPYHMRPGEWPERAQRAFRQLCDEIELNLRSVSLRPGDLVFIDNFRAVHGRKAFRPRYDSSDRWLKRLNITRNLRESRAWRTASDGRVIY